MTLLRTSRRRLFAAAGPLLPVAGLVLAALPMAAAAKIAHTKNVDRVLAFCKAGQDRDLDKQMSFIAENAIYHNMPDEPVSGTGPIRALLAGYTQGTDEAQIIVHYIAEASPGIVLTERLDRFRVKDKWIDCPVMGTCEIKDGKIVQWRDYYDNLRLRAQMG